MQGAVLLGVAVEKLEQGASHAVLQHGPVGGLYAHLHPPAPPALLMMGSQSSLSMAAAGAQAGLGGAQPFGLSSPQGYGLQTPVRGGGLAGAAASPVAPEVLMQQLLRQQQQMQRASNPRSMPS